jgi:polysaccharide biosynthesis protein PslH
VRILLVSARAPKLDGKGDQIRAAQLLADLPASDELVLIRPDTAERCDVERRADVHRFAVSYPRRVLSTVLALTRGRPLQAGWFGPQTCVRLACDLAPTVDLVVFVTARTWCDGVTKPRVVDHVDALSLNARRRGAASSPILRPVWRYEGWALRRLELRIAAAARAQIVTAPEDAAALAGTPEVIPTAAPDMPEHAAEPHPDGRDIDVIFTGNMRYPPNRDAARWLVDEIGPALRAKRNDTRIAVVGRDADRVARADQVEVISDVPSLADYIRRAKVAVAPIRHGTGVSTKVMEATVEGAAVVATPSATSGIALPADAFSAATGTADFVREITALLDDPQLRSKRVARAREHLAAISRPEVARAYRRVLGEAVKP